MNFSVATLRGLLIAIETWRGCVNNIQEVAIHFIIMHFGTRPKNRAQYTDTHRAEP